jgi:hypothetical protein
MIWILGSAEAVKQLPNKMICLGIEIMLATMIWLCISYAPLYHLRMGAPHILLGDLVPLLPKVRPNGR